MKSLKILPMLCLVACPSRSPEVLIEPESPVTADELQVSLNPADPTATFQWSLEGITQTDLTGEAIAPELTSKGQRWSVIASSESRTLGSAEVFIGNTPPTATASLPPKGTTGRDVVATAEGADEDGDTIIFRYAWSVDGEPVAGTDSILPASVPAPRGATVEVTVTPNDGESDGAAVSASTIMGNGIPSVTGAVISPQAPTEHDVVTCAGQGWADPDGDAEGYLVKWNVNNVEVSTEADLTGASFNKGDVITCFLTAWDGSIEGNEVMSDPVSVVNAAPVLEALAFNPEVFRVKDTLTAVPVGLADVDGDDVQVLWEWELGEVAIEDFDDSIRIPKENAHQEVTVYATPTDGELKGPRLRLESVVANTPPDFLVSMGTKLQRGDTPTAFVTGRAAEPIDVDGDDVTFSYAWEVNGAAVDTGKTCGKCDLVRGDLVDLTVTGDDGYGGVVSVTWSKEVQNTPPTGPTPEFDSATGKLGSHVVCEIVSPSTDVDGDTLTYTFGFRYAISGITFAGTAMTTTFTGDTLPSEAVRLDETVECDVWVSDGTVTVGASTVGVTFSDCGPLPSTTFSGAKNAKAVYEHKNRCFYLSEKGGTCDQACASVRGANRAVEGMAALSPKCAAPVSDSPADYFANNGNVGTWSLANPRTHGLKSLGNGRVNGFINGACNTGTTVIGAYPGESNSDSARSLVCACF